MDDLILWFKAHVAAWATSAALTLALVRIVTPNFVDFIIDWLSVLLVWVAVQVTKSNTAKRK